MRLQFTLGMMLCLFCGGCMKPQSPPEIVVRINDRVVAAEEFEDGFMQSAYALRADKIEARKDYLDNLINQKLIVQYAVANGFDRQKDFLRSVERFWEQSLMTVALGFKTKEINGTMRVNDSGIRDMYEQMVRDGVTSKSYEEMYPQIKWQAERQQESQRLNDWMDKRRKDSKIEINFEYFKKSK
ncbi:MAG: hypothetical protein HQL21_09765 [Candidatus Omnitrophica bacterium]|nr:hypothetical protein [Candidatus Omnitrophota bacterium]